MTNQATPEPASLQELVVSSLTISDALAKLLIEKGLISLSPDLRILQVPIHTPFRKFDMRHAWKPQVAKESIFE
jgi:hypothetical protein